MSFNSLQIAAFETLVQAFAQEYEDAYSRKAYSWVSRWAKLLDVYTELASGKTVTEACFWMVPQGDPDTPGHGVCMGASQAIRFGVPVEQVVAKCYFRVK